MLYPTLLFLLMSITAGVLGFSGIALAAAGFARMLSVIFLVLCLISIVVHSERKI